MKRKRSIAAGALLAFFTLGVLGTLEVLRGPRSVFFGFDRNLQKSYEAISPGAEKWQAMAALGQPWQTKDVFCLPQRHGFENYFEAAERSSAVEYLLWINGTNWFYCIGFDSEGKVVVKGEGHS